MAIIMDFGPFSCPKCTNSSENSVTYYEADKDREDEPRIEHLTCECSRCKYEWNMRCSDLDIEQDFGDLDLFTNKCPKCGDHQLKMELCTDGSRGVGRRHHSCELEGQDSEKEHLHNECEVCQYKWYSVTADWTPEKEAAKEPEVKPEPEKAMEADLGIQPT